MRMTRATTLTAAVAGPSTIALAVTAATAPWLCAWLLFLMTFVIAWAVSWRTSRDPFAPLMPAAAYLFLGLGVRGVALRQGWVPNHYNISLGDQWLTASVWLLGALATMACVLGYRSSAGITAGRRWGAARWTTVKWPRGLVVGFSIGTALVGLGSLVLLRHRFAGVVGFGQTPAAVASQTSSGGLFTIDMLAFFPMAGVLLTWQRRGLGLLGQFALIANLSLVAAWFLLAGRKSLLFEMILGLMMLWHYRHRRIRGRTLIILLVPSLVIVSLAFYFKDYGFKTQSISAQYSERPAWEAVIDPLLDRSYQFDATTMIMAKTTSASDYRLGSTFEDLLWFYIPRQWWSDKPVSFGYEFAPEFFPGASLLASYAPSMVGELYLNFSLFGVVFGFYLFGVILRASYEAFATRRTQLATALYAICLFRLANMIEGPITTHIEFLMAELLPFVLFVIAGRTVTPEQGYLAPLIGDAKLSAGRQDKPFHLQDQGS
jgi:hypothetical protein